MNSQAKLIPNSTIEFEMYGVKIKIEWLSAFRWRNIDGLGDVPSVLTQCLLYVNGFLVSNAFSFKHSKDEHNENYAKKLTAKKAFEKYKIDKVIREYIWNVLNTNK